MRRRLALRRVALRPSNRLFARRIVHLAADLCMFSVRGRGGCAAENLEGAIGTTCQW